MLIYKKEEKQNFLKWFILSFVIFLCYNIFICVIMSFIKIKTNLITLSITNVIIISIMALIVYKQRKVQKYFINIIDIIVLVCMLILTIGIMIKNLGFPLNIKHIITDATVHYFAADEFYNYSMLLFEKNSDVLNLWNVNFLMPGAYINTGILFKIFSKIIDETFFYEIYFSFDTFIYFLSGILMYILLSQKSNQNKKKIVPFIIVLIYMLAYPLNSYLSGFSYLSLGLDIIIAILIVMNLDIKEYYKCILMFFLNFGIMFSYYFFAPVIYLAVFLQIIIELKKNKQKIFSKINLLKISFTLIFPGIFGIMYFVIFQMLKYSTTQTPNYMKIVGYSGEIYQNFIGNISVFLILSIIYLIYSVKNKKNELSDKMLILEMIFISILFVGMKINKVSEYYYYKCYYFLWLLVVISGYKFLNILYQKKLRIIVYIFCILYFIGIFYNKLFLFDIYRENESDLEMNNTILQNDEVKLIQYYNNNLKKNQLEDNTYICLTSEARARWIYVLTKNAHFLINGIYGEQLDDDIKQYEQSNKKYFVLFKRDYEGEYEKIKESLSNQINIILENNAGMILDKN